MLTVLFPALSGASPQTGYSAAGIGAAPLLQEFALLMQTKMANAGGEPMAALTGSPADTAQVVTLTNGEVAADTGSTSGLALFAEMSALPVPANLVAEADSAVTNVTTGAKQMVAVEVQGSQTGETLQLTPVAEGLSERVAVTVELQEVIASPQVTPADTTPDQEPVELSAKNGRLAAGQASAPPLLYPSGAPNPLKALPSVETAGGALQLDKAPEQQQMQVTAKAAPDVFTRAAKTVATVGVSEITVGQPTRTPGTKIAPSVPDTPSNRAPLQQEKTALAAQSTALGAGPAQKQTLGQASSLRQPAPVATPVQPNAAKTGVQALPVAEVAQPIVQTLRASGTQQVQPQPTEGKASPAQPAVVMPAQPSNGARSATLTDPVSGAVKRVDGPALISTAQQVQPEAVRQKVPVERTPTAFAPIGQNPTSTAVATAPVQPVTEIAKLADAPTVVSAVQQVHPQTVERKVLGEQTQRPVSSVRLAAQPVTGLAPTPAGVEPEVEVGQVTEKLSGSSDAIGQPKAFAVQDKGLASPSVVAQTAAETTPAQERLRTDAPHVLMPDVSASADAKAAAAAQDAAPKAAAKPFTEALMAQVKSVDVSEGRTTISLMPRGLGAIEVEVIADKDVASKVVVRVENPAVLQALRDDRQMLAQAIGVSDSSIFDFQEHSAEREFGNGENRQGQGGDAVATGSVSETPHRHLDVVHDDQLDILT